MHSTDNRQFPAVIVCIAVIVWAIAVPARNISDPTNPLKGTLTIHDPSSIQKDGDSYYTFGSHGSALTSNDRITWKSGTSVIRRLGTQSWWAVHGGDIWAPECVRMDGVWYFFYSVSAWMEFNSAIGVATSPTIDPDNPEYQWEDQGLVIDSLQAADGGPMVNVIDPGTFLDDDGKWYMIFGSFQGGVRLIELDRATGKPVHDPPEPVVITTHLGEASFLLHWKEYYYCTVSTGTCCKGMESTYKIVYGRATSVEGPYTNREGRSFKSGSFTDLLSRDYDDDGAVLHAGMGCSGFFWDNDTLLISYHAYTAPGGDALLNIKPICLDSEGWLTMDPEKGTPITGGPTEISRGNRTAGRPVKKPADAFVRKFHFGNGLMNSEGPMYSITGKRCNRAKNGRLPAGIYIEKRGNISN